MKKLVILLLALLLVGCGIYEVQNDAPTKPPSMFLKVKGEKHFMHRSGYTWSATKDKARIEMISDSNTVAKIVREIEPIVVDTSNVIEFQAVGEPDVKVFLWNEETGKKEEIPYENNRLFSPDEPGKYVYEIKGIWEYGEAIYNVVLEVE